MGEDHPSHRGRAARNQPGNRFTGREVELDPSELTEEDLRSATRYLLDSSRSVISRNASPDVGFEASLNPYRGCEHGCAYCYARPTHEYLGLSAGLDFERMIFVKRDAPVLLERALAAKGWEPRTLALSGVTDPYQPVERRLQITRGCLEVLARCRQPVSVITKNRLVVRDAEILAELARHGAAQVTLSITTLDDGLRRTLEPRTSSPAGRLAAISELRDAGVPVGVNVAPVIPGLTDHELPAILEAAREAGASHARYQMLRLPGAVAEIFLEWLEAHRPERAARVRARIREVRGGKLNESAFGERMRGRGTYAEQIRSLYAVSRSRLDFPAEVPALSGAAFRPPGTHQPSLFGSSTPGSGDL